MRVLIVAKTRMQGAACVGGLCLDTNQSVRLLQRKGLNQPLTTDYDVGQIWDLGFDPSELCAPPHIEDVLVYRRHYVGQVSNLRDFLLARIQPWWGGIDQLFNGVLQLTANGSGYISRRTGIPSASVGFWLPDRPIERVQIGGRMRYRYRDAQRELLLPYVGFSSKGDIPPGALLRVSLARLWRPDETIEERCYLQLSGWFS